MHGEMANWWRLAQADFAKLENNNIYAQVRQELLASIKDSFLPIGVLDQFQTAGVFVNWWQTIKYDLKTIINSGWNQTLIPDDYMIAKFFRAETVAIGETESLLSEAEANLTEAIETVEYEAEEDEKVTAGRIKSYLKDEIESLEDDEDESKAEEIAALKQQLKTVAGFEKEVKGLKATLRRQKFELERKLQFKREGIDEERAALTVATENKQREIAKLLDAPAINTKAEKARQKTIKSLEEDKERYSKTLAGLEGELEAIGGVITTEEARELILQKLHDLINNELLRYLNAEKRALVAAFEKLWDKYAVSAQTIESEREATMRELNDYLTKLGYLLDEFVVAQA
jgi:type I restriction enzyme M protein